MRLAQFLDEGGERIIAESVAYVANLVSNAAQHGSAGTPIVVQVTGHDQAVEVRTENESEPMAAEALQCLFEPLRFFAAPYSGTRHNLGLGLFIVREIARAHGGEVTVSTSGRRVSFKMLLHVHVEEYLDGRPLVGRYRN